MELVNWHGLFGTTLDTARDDPVTVLGIDLGTTYSTVTRIEWSGKPNEVPRLDVVPIMQSDGAMTAPRQLVPSTVAVDYDGRILIGQEARAFHRKTSRMLVDGANYFEATKNDIGTSKTFPHAPDGLKSPSEVAAQILEFIYSGVKEMFPTDQYDRVVVTVPASFQLTQRDETLMAVTAADIPGFQNDLLDEPIAALLAWLSGQPEYLAEQEHSLVVDFGGGTCDVAMLTHQGNGDGLDVEVVGTSRYCRLGGSDIDRAIAVDVLLPRLAAASGVSVSEWSYPEKNGVLIPALAGAAEELKLKLNRAMYDRTRNGQSYEGIKARGSRDAVVVLRGATLRLPVEQISLAVEEFLRLLEPVINPERMLPVFGEYFEMASVFAPITELLRRADREFTAMDHVLLAGGSSYLEPVKQALERYFGVTAHHVTPPEAADQQTEISRGAALQAFALAINDEPLAQVVSGEALYLRRIGGRVELVPANVPLPWQDIIPEDTELLLSDGSKPLLLEIERAGIGLTSVDLPIPEGSKRGDRFTLEYGMDANGVLHMSVEFKNGERQRLDVARPGSYIANPGVDREKILELEGELTLESTTLARGWEIRRELVTLYRRIGHKDHALALAESLAAKAADSRQRAIAARAKALVLEDQGHIDEAVHTLETAIADGAVQLRFSLAFMLDRAERYGDALEVIDEVLASSSSGPEFALRGSILKGLGESEKADRAFERARKEFGHPRTASDFERSWMRYVAKHLGDDELLVAVRAADRAADDAGQGALPMIGEI